MAVTASIGGEILDALGQSFGMFWEILWALILGFALSAVVQAVVSKEEVVRLMPDDSPRSLGIACGLGVASSSCSYAAVALARSLFRKGANFTASITFEFASTNLVIELGILLVLLLGWQFAAAEYAGGIVMILLLALMFRVFLRKPMIDAARRQADKGIRGVMEGHAEMDMSVTEGPLLRRIRSPRGFTAISHYFVMDWASIWKDIALGLLLAGALAAWVPDSFWRAFFLSNDPTLAKIWGPIVGPLISVVSFVCSIGNVPLALVLWSGGISFGGVIAFIFADLIILPILNIYRKYYGGRMAAFLFVTSLVAMAGAAYVIELVFGALGLIPETRPHLHAGGGHTAADITLNYTSFLNIAFLVVAAILVARFLRSGGPAMLRMMNGEPGPGEHAHHDHG